MCGVLLWRVYIIAGISVSVPLGAVVSCMAGNRSCGTTKTCYVLLSSLRRDSRSFGFLWHSHPAPFPVSAGPELVD